jgi:carbonic anhydrase
MRTALAVVAVLLQEGEDNPLVRELWNDLPKEKEKEELWTTSRLMYPGYCPLMGTITPFLGLSLRRLAAKT